MKKHKTVENCWVRRYLKVFINEKIVFISEFKTDNDLFTVKHALTEVKFCVLSLNKDMSINSGNNHQSKPQEYHQASKRLSSKHFITLFQ